MAFNEKTYFKEYYQKNKEKCKAKAERYYLENKEKVATRRRKYSKKN